LERLTGEERNALNRLEKAKTRHRKMVIKPDVAFTLHWALAFDGESVWTNEAVRLPGTIRDDDTDDSKQLP